MLLCCSKDSLASSWWVEKEITAALHKERELHRDRGETVYCLIPLDLDGYLLSGKWTSGQAAQVQERRAADFTGWESDNAKYEAELEKVVEALRTTQGT